LEFSSIGYVSDFNILNQEQTEKFLIELADLERKLVDQPTMLLKEAFKPLVALSMYERKRD